MEQRVFPYLLYEDGAAAIEFLTRAFGFREEMRTSDEGMHAELEAPDGGWVHLGQRRTGGFRNPAVVGSTSLVYALVDDVDSHFARAKAAGARIIDE
ncbi:MAG: VOC family protein, partial [Gaiellaceae bacterium]